MLWGLIWPKQIAEQFGNAEKVTRPVNWAVLPLRLLNKIIWSGVHTPLHILLGIAIGDSRCRPSTTAGGALVN